MTGTIQVNYLNGNREGISTYTLSRNVDRFDVSGKETETCKINFKNNIPSGEYYRTITSKSEVLTQEKEISILLPKAFDENGYKTGDWNIKSKKIIFRRKSKKIQKGYCYWYISRISSTGEINKDLIAQSLQIVTLNLLTEYFRKTITIMEWAFHKEVK
ncbi:MAG: hypothetical protein IPH56_05160 [Chitinophagaceae bacterium]|nr:hypothetical protein [Chitinophagaceae bacterium]